MSQAKQTHIEQETLLKNWGKHKGSIVMTVDDKVYVAKSAKRVHEMIRDIEKKHHKRPLITVIPKEDALILIAKS